MHELKITAARVDVVEVPDEDLLAGPAARLPVTRTVVVLRLATCEGVEGLGICYLYAGFSRALAVAAEEMAALVVGEDVMRLEAVHAKLARHAQTLQTSGIFLTALSAIDCALWDIRGKASGQPLWKLLGGRSNRCATYASGMLHRGLSDAQVVEEATRLAARGFRTIKLHLALDGRTSPEREVSRARAVKQAIGADVQLTCDINERWSVGRAIDMGHRLQEAGMHIIEDPTRFDDHEGQAAIRAALPTSIMAGENCWGAQPFREMMVRRSVDVVMIDLMHVGGITFWLKIAGMAEAFNLPVVSHIMPEFQAQLVAALPNGMMAEYKEWNWRLFEGCPVFEDGEIVLSDRPGHGLIISEEFRGKLSAI